MTTDSSSASLRVCHVAYTFHESDNRVMRYARALSARGDSVDLVALRAAGAPWRTHVDGLTVYQIQRRRPTETAAWVYLLKLLWFCLKATVVVSALQLRRRYHVVHVHNVPDFLVFVAWLPKLMGARIILDIHDMLPELYAGKFNQGQPSSTFRALAWAERLSCRFADHVIASNDLWRDKIIGRSVTADRCSSFINYPDLAMFRPDPTATVPSTPFVFLYPGSLNHHQGVDLAVRAFALARDRMANAQFHIYGRGPALPELRRLVAAGDLGDVVKIMDFVPAVEMAAVMARAGAGVVPKRADGFGNEAFSTKILEFMACGVPVVVSRTRIDAYYFDDSVVNFFEPGDVESLAEALVRVYGDQPPQRPRVAAATALAARLSWQARRADYTALVDSLATQRDAVAVAQR